MQRLLEYKWGRILLSCFAVCLPVIIAKMLHSWGDSVAETQAARPVEEWKKNLKGVGFNGTVKKKEDFNYSDRGLYSIELYDVTVENEQLIPANCEFFNYKNGILKFSAYAQTVNVWPKNGLETEDIIQKKVNNDTLFVYTSGNNFKFSFELFQRVVKE